MPAAKIAEKDPQRGKPLNIILTGSTGNLGSYVLSLLIQSPDFGRIVCFNRSLDALKRQSDAFESRDLQALLPNGKVRFVKADLADEMFGLEPDLYEKLACEADIIIHNAWPVDFNLNFATFTPSITGVDNLLTFACSRVSTAGPECGFDSWRRTQPVNILFISSVAVAGGWNSCADTSRSKVPESELLDWKLARNGYGQSKLTAERLLAAAAHNRGVGVGIARVGQLAGPVHFGLKGAWPAQEWLPSLVRSSETLGVLPADLGPADLVDWVPVDVAAEVVLELAIKLAEIVAKSRLRSAGRAKGGIPTWWSIANPKVVVWKELVPAFRTHLSTTTAVVPFAQWVDLLQQAAETSQSGTGLDIKSVPALKLLDFFETLRQKAKRYPTTKTPLLDTKLTARYSPSLAGLQEVNADWVTKWMEQWGFCNTTSRKTP